MTVFFFICLIKSMWDADLNIEEKNIEPSENMKFHFRLGQKWRDP